MVEKKIRLTEKQRKIVELKSGKHLVLSPPGTGKTELLAHRVLYGMEQGVSPEEMICLTFTNRAARNMLERVEARTGETGLFVGNIHKFGWHFLRKNKLLPGNAVIIDEEDAGILMQEACQTFFRRKAGEHTIRELINYNAYHKRQKLGIPCKKVFSPVIKDVYKIIEEYEKKKSDFSLVDFDDILTYTYHFLTTKENLKYASFKWMQVDEVQDLNDLQWLIVEKLINDESLCVFFGDYEQAIFGFLGASPEVLKKIEKKVKESNGKIYTLSQNFRSPEKLLNLFVEYARTYLKPAWKEIPRPATRECPECEIKIIRGDNVSFVNNLLKKYPDDNVALLVLTNKYANQIYSSFPDKEEVFKVSGFDFFSRASVKALFGFFGILNNPLDAHAWVRTLYTFKALPHPRNTLKEMRKQVKRIFDNGIMPPDLLEYYNEEKKQIETFFLKEFSKISQGRIIVFDTETTGVNTHEDDIVQLAGYILENGKEIPFNYYLNTDKDLTPTQNIHGITADVLREKGEEPRIVLKRFKELLTEKENTSLVAHNLRFDYSVLFTAFQKHLEEDLTRVPVKLFDTLQITRLLFPRLHSYKLEELIEEFKLEGTNSHNALEDSFATMNLLHFLLQSYELKAKLQQGEKLLQDEDLLQMAESLRKNLLPAYSKTKEGWFSTKYSLEKYIRSFLNYLEKNNLFPPKTEKEIDKREFQKLIRHLQETFSPEYENYRLSRKINDFLHRYSTYKEADLYIGTEKIVISTVHKAKGLEFDSVILEQTGDYTKRNNAEKLKVFYVAMTRAKKRLYFKKYPELLKNVYTF